MTPRTPTSNRVDDDEEASLLRSRTSSRPNAAVWMSLLMVVAGAVVLGVGAAPSFLKTGTALVNGATYHPESAAAEAAVLEAEVIQPDGGMLRRETQRDQLDDAKAAIELVDETEASDDSVDGGEAREQEEAEERRRVEKKQRRTEKMSTEKAEEEPEARRSRELPSPPTTGDGRVA